MADNDRPESSEVPPGPGGPAAPEPPPGAEPPPAPGASDAAPGDAPPAPGRVTAAEKPRMGSFGRVLSVFISPGAVFADIARKPSITLALILLTAVSVGSQAAVIPHLDMGATIRERMAKQGQHLSDAQMDRAISMAGKFKYVGVAIGAVATPVLFLILGLVFWLGVKLMGSDAGFVPIFSTVLHAFIPAAVVGAVITAIVVSRAGMMPAEAMRGLVKSNLGAFLPASTGPMVHALAASVDVFTAWALVLLALGLSVVGRIKQSRATTLVVVLFLVYVAGRVGLAAIGHAFGA